MGGSEWQLVHFAARTVATSHGRLAPFGGEMGPASDDEPEEPPPELPPLDDVLLDDVLLDDPELDEEPSPDEPLDEPELLDVAATPVGDPPGVHVPRSAEGECEPLHEVTRIRGANAAIEAQERFMGDLLSAPAAFTKRAARKGPEIAGSLGAAP
jgi:hypothetical protein